MLAEEEYKNNKKMEMKDDAMKNLEYRTYDSKRELDILEATDKVKELNRREANIDFDNLMKKIRECHDKEDIDKKNLNNKIKGDNDFDKKNLANEKKEIEKMFKKIKNQKNIIENSEKNNNSDILDKLIKGIDYKITKSNKNDKDNKDKEKKLKEKIENNFFLKKKIEREEKDLDNDIKKNDNKFGNFLDNNDDDSSNNSEKEKNIRDIFKKPLINFSKFKQKK